MSVNRFFFLFAGVVFAQESALRNPFESWFYIKEREEKVKRKVEIPQIAIETPKKVELQLKGILSGKKNFAIINNEILGEGEVIEGKKIVRIEKKKVILRDLKENEETILELTDEL